MAGGLTNYGAGQLLTGAGSLPQTLYVKLHTGNPGADALLLAAAATTRPSVTLQVFAANVRSNAAAPAWSSLPATETARWVSLWSLATFGNPWLVGQIDPVIELIAGGAATIAINGIRITLTPSTG